jgi:hypothetical protein
MNFVSADVAADVNCGSLYLDGLLHTATMSGLRLASSVSEPTNNKFSAENQFAEASPNMRRLT